MEIIVCIKRVPDTATRIEIGADGTTIDASNVDFITSPYDEYALETALRLKDTHGGSVTVLSLGPAAASKELRDCLAKGADKAVLLKGETGDPLATARVLADAIAGMGAELVLFGYKAADDDNAQVGSMVATLIDQPVVTEVVELTVADGKATCHREIEGGHEVVEATLPACVTCHKGANEPRIANLKGIMMAKKKPLEERDASVGEAGLSVAAMAFPPARAAGRVLDGGVDAVPEVVRYLKDELKLI